MPYIPLPYEQTNTGAVEGFFGKINDLKRQKFEKDLLQAVMQGGSDPESIRNAVTGVRNSHTQKASGGNFLQNLMNTVNPAGGYAGEITGLESQLAGAAMSPRQYKLTERDQLIQNGLTPEEADKALRIKSGLAPRASNTDSDKEDLSYWGTQRQKAMDEWGRIIDKDLFDRASLEIAAILGKSPKKNDTTPPPISDPNTLESLMNQPQSQMPIVADPNQQTEVVLPNGETVIAPKAQQTKKKKDPLGLGL